MCPLSELLLYLHDLGNSPGALENDTNNKLYILTNKSKEDSVQCKVWVNKTESCGNNDQMQEKKEHSLRSVDINFFFEK